MTSDYLVVLTLLSAAISPVATADGPTLKAVNHSRRTIYHSPQTPGFTSWVGAWAMPDGSLMVSFTQATGPVKGRPRAPKEVLRKLSWPPGGNAGYDMTGLDLRNVHLRSTDAGKTWKKVSADSFKSCLNGITGEAQTALPDGTIIRGVWGYYLPYNLELPKTGYLERSTDGSKTWGKPEVLLDPAKYSAWPKRLRVLKDGRLIALGGLARVPANSLTRREYNKIFEPLLLVSENGGKTWGKPIEVPLPRHRKNWGGEEFDVAELPNGDLLCVFRRGGEKFRWQGIMKKRGKIWIPGKVGPAVLPHSGHPELLSTSEGPILHVATSGIHWTTDAGHTWHKLDVPGTAYYPRSIQAEDGTIYIFGHIGGDNSYGSVDQSIVMDSFRLADNQSSGSGIRPDVLELRLKKTPKPNYGVPVPTRINGHVMSRSNGVTSGVKDVSVTDGYSVAKTDARGAYALTPHTSAVFVYITRPAGHDVQGEWYKPLAAKVNFDLKPATHDENEYTFVHVSDTHVSTNPRSVAGLSRFVREVNALTPKPRFIVNSGDLLNLSKSLSSSPASGHASFRNYVGIMNHLTMPYYNVAGDHTDSSYRLKDFPRGDHRCGKPMFWEYLGPNFFSFEYGKIHFMSIDFGYHLGRRQIQVSGQTREYPTNQVQPIHTKWMRQDMAQRSQGTFVVTTSEHDLAQHCPGFLEMAKQHDVRFQLVGDHHIVAYKARPVPYRVGGALAGCWWNPKARQLCPDLSPQGYLIYRVTGEKMDAFYKGLGQRVAIVSHRVGAAWSGRVQVQAHLVQPQPDEALEYSLDGTKWKPMREIGRPFYRALFAATIDSTTLADGRLNFSVRSTATGEVRPRKFVVVNGGGLPVFKTDASLSFTVGADTGWTTHRAPAGKADVLFNGKVIGVLDPKARKNYSFTIKASSLGVANTLSFRFAKRGDGMSLSSPVLKFQGKVLRDPRDVALRQVRAAHWGAKAADWGGFIVGDAEPPDETPFHRKQDHFCFVLSGGE